MASYCATNKLYGLTHMTRYGRDNAAHTFPGAVRRELLTPTEHNAHARCNECGSAWWARGVYTRLRSRMTPHGLTTLTAYCFDMGQHTSCNWEVLDIQSL